MSKDRRTEEKERLWNEVLGKKRAYESTDASEQITLSIDSNEQNQNLNILKQPDRAMQELNAILRKQQKDLEDMHAALQKKDEPLDISAMSMDVLERDLKRDYGLSEVEQKPTEKKEFNSQKLFDDIYNVIISRVMGQKDAIHQMVNAFRRPYLMGEEAGKAKNVILVSGPVGSGRHEAVTQMARSLYERQVFISDEVYTIDMSRYTSSGQEQIFLQDLYEAISGNGSVICFENFENGFPAFLRMISSLVTTGSCVLNKRYVLNKGVLVENQTGLVKDSVDTLSVGGKYLVFMTTGSVSKVQDAFGADFMYHVLDTVTLKKLDDESIRSIVQVQAANLIKKAEENLKIKLVVEDSVQEWVIQHFNKDLGAASISSNFYDFYVSLGQAVLDHSLGNMEEIKMTVKNDIPVITIKEEDIQMSRSRNSSEELEEVNRELSEIIGLDEVKAYITSLQSLVAIQQKRREQGMKTATLSKHMIFTGNPGTGKTTIARLISRYMKAIGALTQGQLVEVSRSDLVAQYVGQTAPLTMSVIKSAIGGVLFIDEAYSLHRGKDDAFGLECIDTLVKAMEDNRDNLIVILAGYKKEMSVFLESNSGLKSRFPNIINFKDYTGEELYQIACLQAKGKGYHIDEAVADKLTAYFNEVQSINPMEAGNGRLARNMIEDAILRQSTRLVSNPDSDMSELVEADFDFTIKIQPPKTSDSPTLEDLLKMSQK